MSDNLLTAEPEAAPAAAAAPMPAPEGGNRPPAGVPAKFWDAEKGEIRVEALLKSYLALEKKLSETGRYGPPASLDEYQIAAPHGLFDADPEINRRLYEAGFSREQAQLVYDMAAEYIVPLIREMAAELQAERELERLVERFGGPAKWREVSRQILNWASKELPKPVVEALSSTEAGVSAMYQMMTAGGANGIAAGPISARSEADPAPVGQQDLDAMIRDPRYWRDKDPSFIGTVTEGFRRKYGN
jgi:hypothetical protein